MYSYLSAQQTECEKMIMDLLSRQMQMEVVQLLSGNIQFMII